MQVYLIEFFELFDYPAEAREVFMLAYRKIAASANAVPRFRALLDAYDRDKDIDYDAAIKEMSSLSVKAGVLVWENGEQ